MVSLVLNNPVMKTYKDFLAESRSDDDGTSPDFGFEADDVDFDVNDIEVGDLVDFGPYGQAYVVDIDYFEKGRYFWVTKAESERFNTRADGHSIEKIEAEAIIERGSEAFDDEED